MNYNMVIRLRTEKKQNTGKIPKVDLERDVYCTKQPLTTELEKVGAYPLPQLLGYLLMSKRIQPLPF